MVTAIWECPRTSMITRACWPWAMSNVPAVCRRSCTRYGGMPARSQSALNSRASLRWSTGVPVEVVKTRLLSAQPPLAASRSAAGRARCSRRLRLTADAACVPTRPGACGMSGRTRTGTSLDPMSRDDNGRDRPFPTAVFDGHNDLPWALRRHFESDLGRADLVAGVPELQTDLPRLRAGGVG